jgi:hypothetical protein
LQSLSIALRSSGFPLYRRITSLLQSKLVGLEVQEGNPWAHLVASLFALSSLCRLHDVPLSGYHQSSSGTTVLQGQASILNGLLHIDTEVRGGTSGAEDLVAEEETGAEKQTEQGSAPTGTSGGLDDPIPSPQSALFSDHTDQTPPA